MDVINAAKKISEHGTNLDKVAKTIAEQVKETYFFATIFDVPDDEHFNALQLQDSLIHKRLRK